MKLVGSKLSEATKSAIKLLSGLCRQKLSQMDIKSQEKSVMTVWPPYLPSVHSALASDIKLMRRANYEQLPILEILFRNFLNFSL